MEFPKVAITSPDAPLERWRSWIERSDFAVDGQDLPMVLLHNDFAAEHVLIDPATQRAACRDVLDVSFGVEHHRPEYIEAGLRALTLNAGA